MLWLKEHRRQSGLRSLRSLNKFRDSELPGPVSDQKPPGANLNF